MFFKRHPVLFKQKSRLFFEKDGSYSLHAVFVDLIYFAASRILKAMGLKYGTSQISQTKMLNL